MQPRYHTYKADNGCVFHTLPELIDGDLKRLNLQVFRGEVLTTAPPLTVVLDQHAHALWHMQPMSRA